VQHRAIVWLPPRRFPQLWYGLGGAALRE
jgi:hypothetical protein